MALQKVTYTDGQTVIRAQNLNDIQDEVISQGTNKLDKNGNGSSVTVAFTEASSRANIATGEKLSVMFGKISKWLSSIGQAAFLGTTGNVTQGGADLVTSGGVYNALLPKYEKPQGGIPATDLEQTVQDAISNADDTYDTTDVTGSIVTFDAPAADMPLKSLVVNIEPVQAEGTPTPEAPLPITGWTSARLAVTGKNILYDKAFTDGTTAGITYTKLDDGTFSAVGTATAKTGRYIISAANSKMYPPGNYQISCEGVSASGVRLVAAYVQNDGESVKYTDVTNPTSRYSFTIGQTGSLQNILFRGEAGNPEVNTILKPLLLFQKDAGAEWEPFGGDFFTIAFPSEAATVYGGKLKINADGAVELEITHFSEILTPDKVYSTMAYKSGFAGVYYRYLTKDSVNKTSIICSHLQTKDVYTLAEQGIFINTTSGSDRYRQLGFRVPFSAIDGYDDPGDNSLTLEAVQSYLSNNEVRVVYELKVHETYQLGGLQFIETLKGVNNIWADCGDVTVTYGAYLEAVKNYADRLGDSILSAIAPLEATYTATRVYTAGSYLFVGTKFYKVTAPIGIGDAINPGTNVTQTTVAEQLIALSFVILEQPHDVEAAIGATGTFSVVARGAVGYLWQYWTPNNPTWRDSSTTTPDYSLEVTAARYTYRYRCKVTGLDGSVIYSQPVRYISPT